MHTQNFQKENLGASCIAPIAFTQTEGASVVFMNPIN